MKKREINSFFKRMSINSNVAKETNPVETTVSVEVPSKPSRSTETKIANEKLNRWKTNEIVNEKPNHIYISKNWFCYTKPIVSSTVVCRILVVRL